MSPTQIALLISLAGNVALGWAWLDTRDDFATATVQRDQARGDASACSDATEALREQADKRAAAGKTATAAARAVAAGKQGRAQVILTTPPSVPGDDYASARRRADDWLLGRAP